MNIGLVLSGGMAKGAYQVGALRAISNFIPAGEIKYASCASIGVLNGYSFITDKLDIAESMWKDICVDNSRLFVNQVLKSSLIQKNISNICDVNDRLRSTFYCTLLDFAHRKIVYKDLSKVEAGSIPAYLKAAVAMPVYNHSVTIDGLSYYDGAMVDNIPVFPLLKHRLDYIICVLFDDTCYKFENSYFDNKVIKITFPCESILKQSLVLRKETVESMINDGFYITSDILNSVLCNGYDDLEYIYKAIQRKNSQHISSLRITGDVLVTNLNRVAQKFAKRNVL